MNFKLLLNDYDKKMTYFYNNLKKLSYEYHISNSDIDNTTITYNNDKNFKYDKYILSYYYVKKDKIKYIWSWSDLNMNNNNNNEIKKIFDYGIKLDNIKNNFIDNIKYFLINNSFYINIYELDIILAVSLYILNCSIIQDYETSKGFHTIYILKKSY